ncbi:MAG: DmsE family decaheme c-type cytochrome [bacterium]|nr:DmsE family decaheme c-type cytochrome [bacterium]
MIRSVSGNRERKGVVLKLLLATLVVCLTIGVSVSAEVENSVCADCHTELSEIFHNSVHGIAFSGDMNLEKASCESCHGSAVDHANEGDPALIINPANQDQFGAKELCLSCHKDHSFDDWAFSSHNAADVTCADCHQVHGQAGVETKSTTELCYDCHGDVRAAMHLPSAHPVSEGKMSCQSCHDPHGGTTKFSLEADSRELCFTCHAGKEGPFAFEHAPVNEDCMICHSPHGSVVDNLLIQSEPTLCLNCHPMHFHTAGIADEATDFVIPGHPDRTLNSSADSFKTGMLTKCTQCHTMVHGTDNPSQEISNGGQGLTR